MSTPIIRFAVIGINHGHIYGQVNLLLRAGAQFVGYYAQEAELRAAFATQYPDVPSMASEAQLLEDPSIQLIVSAGIPEDRAPLGIRVMQHGKDYMVDKPGFTTLEQLAQVKQVQAETKRILFDLLQRTARKPFDSTSGRTGQERRYWASRSDHRNRGAPYQLPDSPRLVLSARTLRRYPV
jgi:predicted dehydrogenase